MPVSETTTLTGAGADDAAKQSDKINKGVIFKNSVPFIDLPREMNNTEIDEKDLEKLWMFRCQCIFQQNIEKLLKNRKFMAIL